MERAEKAARSSGEWAGGGEGEAEGPEGTEAEGAEDIRPCNSWISSASAFMSFSRMKL